MDTNCSHCGANLTPADMQLANCRYCGTVLPHRARAAQRVAEVNALLGDANGNGIPDALEGMIPPGMMPPRPMPPHGAAPPMHGAPGRHLAPPPFGGPVGAPIPPMTGGPVGQPIGPSVRLASLLALAAIGFFLLILIAAVLLFVVTG